MTLRDVGLFLRSARTDAAIGRLRGTVGDRGAFEALYQGSADPWASASPRYRYQRLKYETLVAMLPKGRRFERALDLGCGVGLMSKLLAARADHVVGVDIAEAAVGRAAFAHAAVGNLSFEQGDVLALPPRFDDRFDLVVLADVLYYLAPLNEAVLATIAGRVADILAPGGVCLLANHFFFAADPDSRVSRRIHRAFAASPRLQLVSAHRRCFYLASVLSGAAEPGRLAA
jgi:SAM-dependent methyltransferase